MLTLVAGERRKLGCSLPAPQTRYTWSVEDCQPRSARAFAGEQLTPTEKKFADAQDAFLDHVGRIWYANVESHYRQLVPGTVRVQFSISPKGKLAKTRVLSNTSNQLAAQLIIDAVRPAIRFLATGKWAKISAELTAFAGGGSDLDPQDTPPVIMVRVSQGGRGYPYESSASYSVHDGSKLKRLDPE